MDVVLDAAIWSVYGLSGLVLLVGIALAVFHRRAHPTAARFAVAGLLCVLADKLLDIVLNWFFPRIPPGSDATLEQRHALDLGGLTLDYQINLVGAIGWTLILVALFAEGSRPRLADQAKVEGLR